MTKRNLLMILLMAIMASCGGGFETTESGVQYKILTHDEGERVVKPGEMLLVNLRLSTGKSDSLLMETFTENNPRYLPADEPVLKEVLSLLAKGDSLEVLVNADTLFQKSFGQPKPESMKDEEHVHFIIKVVDVFDQAQLKAKSMEQIQQMADKDSLALSDYLSKLGNFTTTPSGLMYIVVEDGKGPVAKKGDKASMKYTGYFLNGEKFDESQDKPFEFTIGMGQVIPGWDEGVTYMKAGGKYKLIIPWRLGYGERGAGPVLPCSSLVFDVEVVKIN